MLKNVLLTGIGLAVIGLMRLAFNAAALHGFGETLAGQLNVALSLSVLLSIPATTAFGGTTVRFVGHALAQGRRGRAAWVYRAMLVSSVTVAGLAALLAVGFAESLGALQALPQGFVLQAAAISLTYTFYLFFRNMLYAVDQVASYTILEVLGGMLFFAALGVCWFLRAGDWLLTGFIAANLLVALSTLTLTWGLLRTPCASVERPTWRELLSFSGIAAIGTAASLSTRELAMSVTPHVADLGGAAHLGLCMSLLAPLQMFPRMLRSAIFAHSAQLDGSGRRDELGRSITEATHWLVVLVIPVCGLFAIVGEPLIVAMGGTASSERMLVFRLMALAAMVEVVATPAANALPGCGYVRAPNYAAVAALVVAASIWLGVGEQGGLVGLAVGMVANAVIKSGVPIWFAWNQLGAPPTRTPGRAMFLLVCTLIAWVGVSVGVAWPWVAVLYLLVMAPAIYPSVRELWALVQRRLPRRESAASA